MNLTENGRGQIIGLYKNGISKVKISKILDFPRTTVIRTIQNFEERGDVKSLPNSGRSKILNNVRKKELKKIIKKDNRKLAGQIKDKFNEITGLQAFIKTIRRKLHDLNINSRIIKLMINIKIFFSKMVECLLFLIV